MNTFLHILSFIGSLGLFLYGMKIMSEGLEKLAGDHMRNILGAMTRNRFMGVLTGVGVTALIQSSSATTVMEVSLVNAGLMTLTDTSLSNMENLLEQDTPLTEGQTAYSHDLENEINNYRNELKSRNLQDIDAGRYSYQLGVFYVDFICECEKLADYVINIVETEE